MNEICIIMGSVSDYPVMEEAVRFLKELEMGCDCLALSAHRTPELVMQFASEAHQKGVKVIIAAAGGAAHLPGVVAAYTVLPVIGVPIKSSNSVDGWDSILSILQMPSGIPVATVALNGAKNAAILAAQMIGISNKDVFDRLLAFKASMKEKVIEANQQLQNKLQII